LKNSLFYKQAELLVRVLPYIAKESDLALKGGTAINFFLRGLPRLSVDIDLCYIPVKDRVDTFQEISASIERIMASFTAHYPQSQITPRVNSRENVQYGFFVQLDNVTIKVETNYVFRGSVFPPEISELSEECQTHFHSTVKMQTLSKADLYGGKICAALDRQHPRDLFDIMYLLENEGLTEDVRSAFIVYLISHPRPMIELLNPNLKDIQAEYETEFKGMTSNSVGFETLKEVRKTLIDWVKLSLTENEKEFLVSFKRNQPNWALLPFTHLDSLPSVKWKLQNIALMPPKKQALALKKLGDWLNS